MPPLIDTSEAKTRRPCYIFLGVLVLVCASLGAQVRVMGWEILLAPEQKTRRLPDDDVDQAAVDGVRLAER